MEFAELIVEGRKKLGITRLDFHKMCGFKFSCQKYKRIEEGFIPDLNTAVSILKALDLNVKNGILCWLRDQCQEESIKSLFQGKMNTLRSVNISDFKVDEAILVNKPQARILLQNPVKWEIINYLIHNNSQHSVQSVSKVFNIPVEECKEILSELDDYGLIKSCGSGKFYANSWIFIDDEFSELRKENFNRSYEQFLKSERQYRITVSNYVTKEQEEEIKSKIKTLVSGILDKSIYSESDSKKSFLYTVGVFSSPRRLGNA